MTVLVGFAALLALFWTLLALLPLRRFPAECRLRPAPPPPAATAPEVVVLVPARDEAAVLPATLPSLLAQDYPGLSVVLVDDGSTDGTAEVARRLQAESEGGVRLQVVAAGAKPPGWAGKMFALARGLETVTAARAGGSPPHWLLLTDADIAHPPRSIASLVATARRGGYDLVSVMARLSTRGAWERLLVPPFVFFFHLLYPFRAVSRRASRVAAAAGGCVLVRTSALVDAGGFAALRAALIDDVALARLLKSRRRRLWLGLDPAIESVRRYSFAELWQMVARSAFVELRYRYWLVPLVVIGLGAFFLGPPLVTITAAWAGARGLAVGASPVAVWAALACGALAWGLETACLVPWARHHRVRRALGWSLLFPVAAALYAGMTVGSAWGHLRGRGSAWKGRGYEAPGA